MTKKRLRKEIEQIKRLEAEAQALYLLDERDEKAERIKKRKADDRQKFQLGGMLKELGFADWPYDDLRAILIWLKEAHDDLGRKVIGLWRPVEIETDDEVDDDPVRKLALKFNSMPTDEAKLPLRRAGFTYNRNTRSWSGIARVGELRAALEAAGAAAIGFSVDTSL